MFKCAFYEKEITPPLGCFIPGYFNLRLGGDVRDRLYSRAMAVQNEENTIAIISIDGCTINNKMAGIIKERITELIGLEEKNILVAYTHTHTGIPSFGYDKDEKAAKNQDGYWEVFSKLIADCAVLAYYRLEESELSFAKGEVEGISFCRDYYMKNSTPQTNPPRTSPEILGPAGETDNELPVLFVKDKDGKAKGALISFACHPDCVDKLEYSGDYISELSIQLKKAFGEDFVTVFLLGACGNINHFDVSKASDAPEHYRKMGRIVAGEALKTIAKGDILSCLDLKSELKYIDVDRVKIDDKKIAEANHIVKTIKEIPGIKIAADNTDPEQYALGMAKRLLNFLETTPESFNIPLQVIKIGDIKLYAMPSEIFCYFGIELKKASDTEKSIVSTLSNGSYAYVPTRDMFYDTIYESRPGSNMLNSEAGYIMVDTLIEMGKNL